MLQKIRWFLLMTGVLVVVIIALQNQQPTRLKLLMAEVDMPLTLLLLATSASSFVFGALMTAWMLKKKASAAKHQKPEISSQKSAVSGQKGQ